MSDRSTAADFEAALAAVEKPGRYTGGEWNAVRKDPRRSRLKVGLAFPDVYEIGMSYLGQKILYDLINARPDDLAERVFAPWPDLEAELRRRNLPLTTLENRIPLAGLDVLGFSLLYELNDTNILTILDLGRIPRRASDRGEDAPLVIGGGPAVFNPEPLAEFFDLFLLGDGEEAVPEILDAVAEGKARRSSRETRLEALSVIPGVYVPSHYETVQPRDRGLLAVRPRPGAPAVIRKRVLRSYARSPFPAEIVVPSLQAVFDRVAVEVARGCPHKCRFCQAANVYAPYRVKDPDFVAATVFESCRSTGYEDASLFSLSVGDYPYLGETIKTLMTGLERDRISLSLSSLRPKGLSEEIIRSIVKVRKTGFTLVPEAGSERLRSVINKNLDEADLFAAAGMAFREGWKLLKLYFMIGLPTETEADLAAIIDLVERLTAHGRDILGAPPRMHLSVSSFIPKPHTAFQWAGMDPADVLAEKQRSIKREMRRFRNVEIKDHPVDNSVLEAVFSRGDRRLGAVLERAWELGCRFDGWRDGFRVESWMRAFEESGIAPEDYLGPLPLEAPLPWDHLETGVRRSFLEAERRRALAGERTPSCLETACGKCRGCEFGADLERSFAKSVAFDRTLPPVLGAPGGAVRRYLVHYRKSGPLRFISHNDLLNLLQRVFLRAGLRVAFSAGFHPKMLMTFAPALPLGMTADREPFEFRSSTILDPGEFVAAMNAKSPEGLVFLDLAALGPDAPPFAASLRTMAYVLDLGADRCRKALEEVRRARGLGRSDIETAAGLLDESRPALSPLVEEIRIDPGTETLVLRIRWDPQKPVRPQDVVRTVLGVEGAVYALRRTSVDLGKLTDADRIGIS
jgi:radical SAM family uncharacterized protein/radical SAM-linked protein